MLLPLPETNLKLYRWGLEDNLCLMFGKSFLVCAQTGLDIGIAIPTSILYILHGY